MPNFKRAARGGGDKKFERRDAGERRFGARPSGKFAMHKATCSECGNACEVPFKPSSDRPVFCNSCFKKGGNVNSERDFSRDSRPAMHRATCAECGDACEVPFKPTGDKPVFCHHCFKKDGNTNSRRFDEKNYGERGGNAVNRNTERNFASASTSVNRNDEQLKEQLEALNSKLDRILKILIAQQEASLATSDNAHAVAEQATISSSKKTMPKDVVAKKLKAPKKPKKGAK